MYSSCPLAHLHTIESPCKLCQAKHKARQNPSLPLERFRCSKCKCFRPITDYPLQDDNYRAFTCRICHERDRDSYRERKGELTKERRAWRFTRAQRVVEKALHARIRGEKTKKWWLEARKRWEQGDRGFVQWQIESFQKGEEYCEGPYRQWVGYTDPREGSIGVSEAWNGPREGGEGSADNSEGWEGSKDGGESFTGESEAWDGPQGEVESSTGIQEGSTGPQEESTREESWEGSTDGGESFTDRQDG